MYEFRLISENIELVAMLKIFNRVDSDTVPICLWRRREFCIKMRIVRESQTNPLVLEMAEVPKNFLNGWAVAKHH
jgi:hypothetical protein